jgi:hypothetical protein
MNNSYKVWFFSGAESRDTKFNVFTGSYIRLMKQILEDNFDHVKGVYYNSNMLNVIWALNNAQKPIMNPENEKITSAALKQIIAGFPSSDTHVTITSSSSGSIVAAQTSCYLAEINRDHKFLSHPFNLVLGASMLSEESELFAALKRYQAEGLIGKIIHDEVLDKDDSANGVGGKTRGEAYSNAFGLMFPFFSKKYSGPSFLNTHPEKGHVHRKRSKTVKKALDYIDVILIRNKLAGEAYREKAVAVVKEVSITLI